MFHQLTIVGNVGREPEMRYSPNGNAVTSVSVATNRTWKSADGQKQKETVWFRCSAWGKTAEVVSQFVHKGNKVLILGRLNPAPDGNPRTYTKQDSSAGASYDVTIETIRFLSSKDEDGGTSEAAPSEEEIISFA